MLPDIISRKIDAEGPISFCEFMEMALYYPGLGYYSSRGNKIGKGGDYFTMPELTCLFGYLLGRQVEEMWALLEQPSFTIIEYGAGRGKLCSDMLAYLKGNEPLYEKLRYCIIEKSGYMIDAQKKLLGEKVEWYNSISEISYGYGCIIANEVLDNFAVHRVIKQGDLYEIFIGYEAGRFVELTVPASQELKDYLCQLGIILGEGCQTEINLEAVQWIRDIAGSLNKGFVIAIDYGYVSSDLCKPAYRDGSLISFTKQQASTDIYQTIGERDITAQVNFSAVKYWGEKFLLQNCGLTLQSYFLHSLGLVEALKKYSIPFYPLVLNTTGKFKVLIMQKGLDKPLLTGMQFASLLF